VGQASTLTEPALPHSQETARRHAACDTRSSRRLAAIGSVIVTLTPPAPADGVSKLDGLTRVPWRRCYRHPGSPQLPNYHRK
jgi:hypothetical protein